MPRAHATTLRDSHIPSNRPINRIAIVTESYPPHQSGAGHSVHGLVNALASRDYQLQLIRLRDTSPPRPSIHTDIDEVLLPRLPLLKFNGVPLGRPGRRRLLSAWERFSPDAVLVATEGPLGRTALNLANEHGIPVFTAFQSGFHHCGNQGLLQFMQADMAIYLRRFHARATATIVPNEDLARELGERGYTRLHTIPAGIETTLFHPHRRSLSLRARWGLDDGALGVLYVGRIGGNPDFDLVLRSFRQIRRQRPDARLIVVGNEWGAYGLHQKYRDVVFCGRRSGEDLAMHYASADILLLPCTASTCGNAILEGMASGLGVIAYAHGAGRMHVQHKRSGLLAKFEEPGDFVRCALELASAPDRLSYLRTHARASAEKRDWTHIVGAYESLFEGSSGQQPPLTSLAS